MKLYKDLDLWIQTKALVVEVYKITNSFPKEEQYGIISQLRRAAVSSVANIAEGYGRGSIKDRIRFLQISRGSLFEVDSLLNSSQALNFIELENFIALETSTTNSIQMVNGIIHYFEKKLAEHHEN
ncbi:MAG: four helix bundle protein [Bacteroidetes bacterium]|nr:four helix bundle protein [Bacteroidota bacterium]